MGCSTSTNAPPERSRGFAVLPSDSYALTPRLRSRGIAVYRAVCDLALLSAPASMGLALQAAGFGARIGQPGGEQRGPGLGLAPVRPALAFWDREHSARKRRASRVRRWGGGRTAAAVVRTCARLAARSVA